MGTELGPGSELAGYLVGRVLGTGGMGTVYLATHPRLPKQVALKVLHTALTADDYIRGRFESEAENAARLDHPNIIGVLDRGRVGDRLWIAMQYVPSIDAQALLKQGPVEPRRAVQIIAEVAKALDFAHSKHVLHRDVKPSNILIEDSTPGDPGRILLSDFGISKALAEVSQQLTVTGMMVASLHYAAPERFDTAEVDSRYDVYALGCTLFELLTGHVPYPGTGLAQIWQGHTQAPIPLVSRERPGLPVALDAVFAKALAKNRDDRYRTCGELAVAARQALNPPRTDRARNTYTDPESDEPTIQAPDKDPAPDSTLRAPGRDRTPGPLGRTPGPIDQAQIPTGLAPNTPGRTPVPPPGNPAEPERFPPDRTPGRTGRGQAPTERAPGRSGQGQIPTERAPGRSERGPAERRAEQGQIPTERAGGRPPTPARGMPIPAEREKFSTGPGQGTGGRAPTPAGGTPIPAGHEQFSHGGPGTSGESRIPTARAPGHPGAWHAGGGADDGGAGRFAADSAPPVDDSRGPRRRTLVLLALAVIVLVTVPLVLWISGRGADKASDAGSASPASSSESEATSGEETPAVPAPVEGFAGLADIRAVAVSLVGDVIVSDARTKRILKLGAGETTPTQLPFAGLTGPYGLAVSESGDIFVTDAENKRVLKLPAGTDTPVELRTDGLLPHPDSVAVDGAGNVYVTDPNAEKVYRLPAAGGAPVELKFPNIRRPWGIAADSAGDIYVADRARDGVADRTGRIWKLAAGTSTPTELPFSGLLDPDGVAVSGSGDVFVVGTGNKQVMKLAAGADASTVLPFTDLQDPDAVAVDYEGAVYVTDHEAQQVMKLPATG
ncbi:protein kinase domain-containing protein [Nocardia jejuensis]|uniref:protein kinase domain-containing protein n=1 Tax=Nocardia jejuensis TaxID=328049 RepID=UPI00082C7658|nr:protein kinase [Nocardia jejuensis]